MVGSATVVAPSLVSTSLSEAAQIGEGCPFLLLAFLVESSCATSGLAIDWPCVSGIEPVIFCKQDSA